jgi:hypothetical protein
MCDQIQIFSKIDVWSPQNIIVFDKGKRFLNQQVSKIHNKMPVIPRKNQNHKGSFSNARILFNVATNVAIFIKHYSHFKIKVIG